ncbi:putative ribonuclease VapC [Methyloglobulus morosus KoM1]|uniref:Putative ribonuclease VapC n=1 Tax=Methyloglobulus morosus KoM1 TaxID=1116472 RepID=V5C1E2_9GAMM|nr:type II toxin-antitoxin system VapC family toxin [Methyloglobulus morosus]ESS73924.1 putative ribonuclease VapC [Methyloglobulus morosus KoM1]
MNVVDSSGWLEYFADGKNADFFSAAIEDIENLIVPVISLYEVFKRVTQQTNESQGLQAIALMQQGKCVDLNPELAVYAGKLSIQHKLPMADSIILATAYGFQATLWTQDKDFEGIPGVN